MKNIKYKLIVALIISVDLIIKTFIRIFDFMDINIKIFPLVSIAPVYNTHGTWINSLLNRDENIVRFIIICIISIIALAFLIRYFEFYVYKNRLSNRSMLYLYLVVGGVFERILRVVFGVYVLDYIRIILPNGRVTIDLADICLLGGAILLVISYYLNKPKIQKHKRTFKQYLKDEQEFNHEFIDYLKNRRK